MQPLGCPLPIAHPSYPSVVSGPAIFVGVTWSILCLVCTDCGGTSILAQGLEAMLSALCIYVFVGTSVIVTHWLLTTTLHTHHSELTCGLGFSPYLHTLPLFYIKPINWRILRNVYVHF